MKIGVRKPSVKRRIKARTTGRAKRAVKRSVNPTYGKKGMGYIKNPSRAAKNAVYKRTTVGVNAPTSRKGRSAYPTNARYTSQPHYASGEYTPTANTSGCSTFAKWALAVMFFTLSVPIHAWSKPTIPLWIKATITAVMGITLISVYTEYESFSSVMMFIAMATALAYVIYWQTTGKNITALDKTSKAVKDSIWQQDS